MTWVCPHDPLGNDRDTATYCPLAWWQEEVDDD